MAESMFDAADLEDLRHHWRGAYIVNGSGACWVATRTDDGSSVFAASAAKLRDRIRRDYERQPVPRPPRPIPDTDRIIRKLGG
jgi:hypothetical protein